MQVNNDHDLLVRVDTKLDMLAGSFSEVKNSVNTKAENTRVDKLENRMELTERKVYMATGGIVVLQVLLSVLPKLFGK
jgi:hypothetical protein